MIHYPRNASVTIPFSALAFNPAAPSTPWAGESSHMTARVMCLDNQYEWDFTNAIFAATPAGATNAVTAPAKTGASGTAWNNVYAAAFDVGTWPRGHYVVQITNDGTDSSGNKQVWSQDFSVGMYVSRQLGYSAVYDGTTLTIAAWIEEAGEAQTDYASLTGCTLYNSAGTVIATLSSDTAPVNGVFTLTAAVTLTPSTPYVLEAVATVAGPATTTSRTYRLRTGMARP